MIALAPAAFFLVLTLLHLGSLPPLIHRREGLRFAEEQAAAITIFFYTLTLLSYLFGFLGIFNLATFYIALSITGVALLLIAGPSRIIEYWRGEAFERTCDFFTRLPPAGWLALGLASSCALYYLWVGIRLPVISFDGLSYHLSMAVHFYQDQDFRYYVGESIYSTNFPRGTELIMALTIAISNGTWYVNAVQWFVIPPMTLCVYTSARSLGVRQGLAVLAATAPCFTPVIIKQAAIAYADLWSNGWFAVSFCAVLGAADRGKFSPWRMIWFLLAGGISLAAKFPAGSMLFFAGLTAIGLWGWREFFIPKLAKLGIFLLGFLLAAATGLSWPIHNWMNFGSPIYPWKVQIGELVLMDAPFETNQIAVMADEQLDQPLLDKTWRSWTALNWRAWEEIGFLGSNLDELPREKLLDPEIEYRGDQRYGGLGAAWIALYLWAMIIVLCLAPFIGGDRRRKLYVLSIPLLSFLCYTTGVATYIPRFSLYLPVFGAICYVYLAEHLHRVNWEGRRLLTAAFLLINALDWSLLVMYNRDLEKVRRYEAQALIATDSPAHWHYWQDPRNPEFQTFFQVMEMARPGEMVIYWTPYVGTFTGYFQKEDASVRQQPFPNAYPLPDSRTPEELMGIIQEERAAIFLAGPQVTGEFARVLTLLREYGAQERPAPGGYRIFVIPQHRISNPQTQAPQ